MKIAPILAALRRRAQRIVAQLVLSDSGLATRSPNLSGAFPAMSTGRALVTNALWALLWHLLSRGSVIMAAIILARALLTPDFAAFSYFQLTVSMIAAYASLGLGITASRYFAEIGHERVGVRRAPLGTMCLVSLLISIGAALLILAIPQNWLSAGLNVPHWMLAAGVACVALGVVPSGAIIGLERYRAATLIALGYGMLVMIGAWLAARYQRPGLAMGALAIGALLQAVAQFMIVLRATGWQRINETFGLKMIDVRHVLQFAGPMFAVGLMAASGSWLVGRIILHGADGKHAFALYSIGLQWFALALVLPGMVSRVVLPRLVRAAGVAREEARQLVRHGAALAIGTATVMTLTAVMLGPWIIEIYGPQYSAGRRFIAAYMGVGILSASANTLGNVIIANDGQIVWLLGTAAWMFVLIITAHAAAIAGFEAWTGVIAQTAATFILVVLAYLFCRHQELV